MQEKSCASKVRRLRADTSQENDKSTIICVYTRVVKTLTKGSASTVHANLLPTPQGLLYFSKWRLLKIVEGKTLGMRLLSTGPLLVMSPL